MADEKKPAPKKGAPVEFGVRDACQIGALTIRRFVLAGHGQVAAPLLDSEAAEMSVQPGGVEVRVVVPVTIAREVVKTPRSYLIPHGNIAWIRLAE